MNKKQKINYVKFWLQRFGERNNDIFFKDVKINDKIWSLWLQYSFDEDGDELDPNSSVSCSNKMDRGLRIEELNDEQIDCLIVSLKQLK